MAKQASQDLNELRDQRESLIRQIDAIQQGDDSPIQQKGYRTAEPLRDARLDEVDKLRQLLTELEERIQGLEDDGAADTSQLASQLEELTPRHGARLAIARTARPWLLPVNALVLSVGVQGGMQGGLSQAMRSDLDESVWQELRSHIQSAVSAIDPETPVLVTLPDALGQQLLPNAPETPDKNANGRYQIIAATPARPNSDALDPSATAKAIIKLATENNIEQLAIPLLGSGRAGLESVRTAEKMLKAIYWAIPDTNNPLKQITLTTRPTADDDKSEVVAAARRTIAMLNANRAQKLSADSATGDDTLGIKTEVFALAETLLLRDVETPLAVGVLGGWGSGKSFVMYLMQQEMMRIRSLKVVDGWDAGDSEPYVGHVYPIEFNAWTYAKSDLWASLMQTIFMELNRQLSLEGLFRNREGEGEEGTQKLLDGGGNWLELNQLGEKERLALLESEVGQETVDSWLRGETEDCLWEAYHKTRSAEAREMETAVHDRNILQSNLETLETALEEAKTEQIPETARQQVWQEIITTAVTSTVAKEIQDNLRNEQDFSEEDLEDLTKLGIKLKQVQPTMTAMWQENNFVSLLKKRKWVILTAVLLFLTALLALLLSDLRQQLANTATYAAFMSFLGGLGSVTLASFRIYQEWAEKIHRWASGINDVINLADEMLAAEEAKLITQKEAETATERQKLESQIDTLNQKIDRHQQRMGIAGEFTSLYDFVSSRLAVGDYEERLGMLHRTQADLQELTDTLMVDGRHDLFAAEKKTFFPRGPARVVLFIDDLDRCPPAKVVEVLEAIQLLLGTKLFVIVLGLDTRYVTRALEKEYAGILKHSGDPSGLDYIEKIIQIPYRVRPIEPKNLQAFLSAQMEMAVADGEETTPTSAVKPSAPETGTDKPVGTTASTPATTTPEPPPIPETISPQVVKFHPEDFNDLKQSCIAIGLTPRSIKRLVNVLKLIKVFWYRTHQGKKEQETKTVINLLALSARYPEIMAQVFRNIEIAYRGETQEQDKQINDYLTQNLENGDLIPEQDLFKTAVANLKLAEITLAELGLSTFHLVRSFSFVGDPAHK